MKLTYFGHSAFQIETQGTTLLVDPFFSDNPHTETEADDLDPDVILLTHAHFDHWGDTPALVENGDPLVIGNFEIAQYLGQHHDYENVQPLNDGGTASFEWGEVTATHARHTSSFPDGTYGGTPNGHILHVEDACIYNAGDTAPFAEMEWIGSDHDVDLAVFPIGDCFTMGIDGALRTADMVKPAQILPVHYDTFPPIEADLDDWKNRCSEAGYQTEVMEPDSVMEL